MVDSNSNKDLILELQRLGHKPVKYFMRKFNKTLWEVLASYDEVIKNQNNNIEDFGVTCPEIFEDISQ